MRKPLIGITCSSEPSDGSSAVADRLPRAYARAVFEAGGIPMVLPNAPAIELADVLDRLDGLLLSGGRDVAPGLYTSEAVHASVEIDKDRDEMELPLIREAFARDMPILGICRGIQALNVALGGSLYQDLPSERPGDVLHRQTAPRSEATHLLEVSPGARIAEALGVTTLRVNSFHHQAVREPAKGLVVVGRAEDGLIEALEAPDRRFVVSVQYHPEEMVGVCGASLGLFRSLIAVAGARCS